MSRVRDARLVLVLSALSAFAPLSMDLYLPALPSAARDLHTTTSATQLTLTACLIGLGAGQLLAGPLSDRLGRRRPLLAGVAVYVVASLLCAVAPDIKTLLVARLMQGFAGAAGIVIARAVVRDRYPAGQAARMFALLLLVSGLAPVVAPVVGAQLLRLTSWRGVFVVLALLGGVLVAAVVAFVPESLPPGGRQRGGLRAAGGTMVALARDRRLMGAALCGGLVFGALFAYIAASPFVLQDGYGMSPQLFSLVFAANGLGIIATARLSAWLAGPVPPTSLLAAGAVCAAGGGVVLVAAVAIGVGPPVVLPALFVVASSVGLVLPNAAALALADHPSEAGMASALLGVTQYAIGAAAAPFAGLAGPTGLAMALVIAVLGAGAVVVVRPMLRVPAT